MSLTDEKLDQYFDALDLAILVVMGECPVCPEANVAEIETLRELQKEIRAAIGNRNRSVPTITSYDDEYRVEPPDENADRDEQNSFKS
jgi:hypothetical protein